MSKPSICSISAVLHFVSDDLTPFLTTVNDTFHQTNRFQAVISKSVLARAVNVLNKSKVIRFKHH